MSALFDVDVLEPRRLFAVVPANFTFTDTASGITKPTSMAYLPTGELLVTERTGALRVVRSGALLSTPAMQLSVDSTGERGLLGVDVDPNFAANHFIYVQYMPSGQPQSFARISRFTLNSNGAALASEKVLLNLDPQVASTSHSAGAIHFGTDGKLYIAVGDNENPPDSQSLTTTHGKLLRINPDGTIPTDNPFYAQTTGANRAIWATGLRNPFTFGVNKIDGTIYINDVGEKSFEEINLGRAGANYGWPGTEGPTADPTIDSPVYAYSPAVEGAGECIIGGAFYTGVTQQFPSAFAGKYFYGDFVQGFIHVLDPATRQSNDFATEVGKIIDIAIARDGSLQVLTNDGVLHTIRYTPPAPTGGGSISGNVVNDTNANGRWDSTEKGIADRSVWLDLNNDGKQQANEPVTKTVLNGKFTFTGLAAGTYKVREVVPAGWKQTSPTNNFGLNITLAAGQSRGGYSFQVRKIA